MSKMKNIMVLVMPEIRKKLEILKKRTGNSVASIIRTAIDEYIERNMPTISDEE